jgi:L,D-peptidoglycan transpeptidase YkuD (ErfK/YbiS/YcfS/YnhG family)
MGIISFNGPPGPLKIEGDGRAPAGVFDLPLAFGRVRPEGVLFPFRATGDRDYWVDDVTSSDYNTWQRIADGANDPKLHWKSVERMVTKGPFYDLGIVVGHNTQQTVKWRGSAIFLHLWEEGKLEPTAGCTSMSKPSMIRLMTWLDANKRPLLVQLPAVELR